MTLVEARMAKGMKRVDAFNKVRNANYRAIVEWRAQIDAILERFDGHPPEEWHELLGLPTTRHRQKNGS